MATKEVRTLLLTTGTAFISGSAILVSTGRYLEGLGLAVVGMAAIYLREVLKEEPTQ